MKKQKKTDKLLFAISNQNEKNIQRSQHCKKKFLNRTRIRVYGFHSWLKLQPRFLIGRDH